MPQVLQMGTTLQCNAFSFWYKRHSAGKQKLNTTKAISDYRCMLEEALGMGGWGTIYPLSFQRSRNETYSEGS